MNKKDVRRNTKCVMESFEDSMLSVASDFIDCVHDHVWIRNHCTGVLGKKRVVLNLHALHFRQKIHKNDNVLIVVHGTASTAASFANCFGHLLPHFSDIWALDLPGFGRSTVQPSDDITAKGSETKSMAIFVASMEALVETQNLKTRKLVLMGHSFGTYVVSQFALKHPDLVQHMVLVAPVGLLPTLSSKGFYWAFFFRDLLPIICDMAVATTNDYWSHVLSNHGNSWGNRPEAGVGSFVSLSVVHGTSIWNKPVAHLLTESKIPVVCIFAGKFLHLYRVFVDATQNNC
jgi:pimeloyl-ACP methyl ester carboxylesterase